MSKPLAFLLSSNIFSYLVAYVMGLGNVEVVFGIIPLVLVIMCVLAWNQVTRNVSWTEKTDNTAAKSK